jgi:hypothetical protein
VLEDTAIAGGGAFARDVARGVDASWVRNLYRFAVRPTIGFYFRISVEEALRRVVGSRDAISYYEAGMDHTHIDDTEESFRVFQSCVIDEYDSMVDEFGLVVIDARQSIEDQQVQMREAADLSFAFTSRCRCASLNSLIVHSRPVCRSSRLSRTILMSDVYHLRSRTLCS